MVIMRHLRALLEKNMTAQEKNRLLKA